MANEITVFLKYDKQLDCIIVDGFYEDKLVAGGGSSPIKKEYVNLFRNTARTLVGAGYFNNENEIFILNGLRRAKVAPLVNGSSLDEGIVREFKNSFFEELNRGKK